MIVEATDSDYILIAMLHYERQCKLVGNEAGNGGLGRVILRRIQTKGKEHAAGEAKKVVVPAKKGGRQMEYVHIPLLCEVMSSLVKEMFDSEKSITPMMNLIALVALGGKFFSFFHSFRLEENRYIQMYFGLRTHIPPIISPVVLVNVQEIPSPSR